MDRNRVLLGALKRLLRGHRTARVVEGDRPPPSMGRGQIETQSPPTDCELVLSAGPSWRVENLVHVHEPDNLAAQSLADFVAKVVERT